MPLRRRRLITAWPALAALAPAWALAPPGGAPILQVDGAIRDRNAGSAAQFDLAMLAAMPQHTIRTRTPWHNGEPAFTGPLLRAVLDAVAATGTTLRMHALNDYRVDVPVEDARQLDVVIAHQVDGRAIGVRDKGPLFVMYPFDRHPELRNSIYLSRCIWQLRRIEVR